MKKRIPLLLGWMALTAALTGCGSTAYRDSKTPGVSSGQSSGTIDDDTSDDDGGVVDDDNSGSGGTTNASSTRKYAYEILGSGGEDSHRVETDSVLKVKVSTGSFLNMTGSQASVGYNCLKIWVHALNEDQEAFIRRSNYTPTGPWDPCYGAAASETLDFSGSLGNGAAQDVDVSIDSVSYDNCSLYGNVRVGGCPMHNLHFTHPVQVQTVITIYRKTQ